MIWATASFGLVFDGWRVLTKLGPLEKAMENHFSILVWKSHEQYERVKRYDTER